MHTHCPLMMRWSMPKVQRFVAMARWQQYKPGDVVFAEGDDCDDMMFFVLYGELVVKKKKKKPCRNWQPRQQRKQQNRTQHGEPRSPSQAGPAGIRQLSLRRLAAGDFFGAEAVVYIPPESEQPVRHYSVIASQSSMVGKWHASDMQKVLDSLDVQAIQKDGGKCPDLEFRIKSEQDDREEGRRREVKAACGTRYYQRLREGQRRAAFDPTAKPKPPPMSMRKKMEDASDVFRELNGNPMRANMYAHLRSSQKS